jgi:hypothetical protein
MESNITLGGSLIQNLNTVPSHSTGNRILNTGIKIPVSQSSKNKQELYDIQKIRNFLSLKFPKNMEEIQDG